MRLQNYMAECGVAARRKCEEIIRDGRVSVNGQIITEMGTQVEPALEHSITSGMFGGMFELVIHDVPKEKAVRCVRQLHAFYTAGWRKLMGM